MVNFIFYLLFTKDHGNMKGTQMPEDVFWIVDIGQDRRN
jgi:hypothetical protein